MIYYNKTKLTQIIYAKNDAFPTEIHPKMILKLDNYKDYNPNNFAEFKMECLKENDSISLHRDYALGDLIQLVPVARKLKEKLDVKNINIITSARFLKFMRASYGDLKIFSREVINHSANMPNMGFILTLNGILEKDHSLKNSENHKHRVNIYMNFFNLKDVDKNDLDWSHNLKGKIMNMDVKRKRKLIGLQIRGSGAMKTLPYEMIKKISFGLVEQGYDVVLIDQDKDKGFEGKGIINLCGQLTPVKVIALLHECDLCLTMDSGVLWMAHSANCPVITFLGSTRESERLSLHPQYPEKAKGIDLTKYINCKPCFETKVNCKGKINCMNAVNYDMIKSELSEKVKTILGE